MRLIQIILALCLLVPTMSGAVDSPVMQVGQILEQTYKDDDFAVVVPERLELVCESGASSPWGFCFAGFETTWRGPMELEVTGSGGYIPQDIFGFAGLTLDYGSKSGWVERSFIGLGLVQGSRNAHPPSWGVGSDGVFVMRGNILNATPQPQRVTLDPAKYAPKDWDGRLWVGLCTHNIGAGKNLRVRILNGANLDGIPTKEPDRQAISRLMQEHQKSYLVWRAQRLEQATQEIGRMKAAPVAAEMIPYTQSITLHSPEALLNDETTKALGDVEKGVLGAQRFCKIVGGNADPLAISLNAARAERDRIGELDKLYDSWKKSGRFGREIGCIVRTASNLDKIGLTDVVTGGVVSASSKPVQISAARHEYEGFQIILTPIVGCSKDVSVAVSDLTGKKGRIAKSDITVNPVGYIRIFPGEAREALAPDPLLIGRIPALKAGENQPVWITVRVPDNTPAGEYRGYVRISSGKIKFLNVPIVLNVRDFAIPHKISLRSSFWMFRDQINRFYGLDEVKLDDYFKWIDMALEHRLCPIDVVEGRCKALVDLLITENGSQTAGTPNPNPDFTVWDRYIDRMVAGGASTIHLGLSHHYGAWFSDEQNKTASPVQIQRVIESVKLLEDHYKSKDVFDLHYLQLRDETSAPESLNVYREVKKALPDVKLLLTAPSADARPLLDIPCPLTPGYDAGWQAEVKKNGGEYWWYVCVAPRDQAWANLFLDQTAAQHRALFWQTWSHGVDGLLYWGMNFWQWYPDKATQGTGWAAGTTGPRDRVPPANAPNFCPLPTAPGDGFSMYPGPTPSQPLSSIRLENMRDGEEDYEYFVILDKLIAQAAASGKNASALAKAESVREEARKLVENMTEYPRTGSPYAAIRAEVGDAIESLMH